MELPSDITLVQAALAGDRGAFGQLIERYRDMVYGVCYRITANSGDAEELLCWLPLWRHAKTRSWPASSARSCSAMRKRPSPCCWSASGTSRTGPGRLWCGAPGQRNRAVHGPHRPGTHALPGGNGAVHGVGEERREPLLDGEAQGRGVASPAAHDTVAPCPTTLPASTATPMLAGRTRAPQPGTWRLVEYHSARRPGRYRRPHWRERCGPGGAGVRGSRHGDTFRLSPTTGPTPNTKRNGPTEAHP
jgi:hypothetical protein